MGNLNKPRSYLKEYHALIAGRKLIHAINHKMRELVEDAHAEIVTLRRENDDLRTGRALIIDRTDVDSLKATNTKQCDALKKLQDSIDPENYIAEPLLEIIDNALKDEQ